MTELSDGIIDVSAPIFTPVARAKHDKLTAFLRTGYPAETLAKHQQSLLGMIDELEASVLIALSCRSY